MLPRMPAPSAKTISSPQLISPARHWHSTSGVQSGHACHGGCREEHVLGGHLSFSNPCSVCRMVLQDDFCTPFFLSLGRVGTHSLCTLLQAKAAAAEGGGVMGRLQLCLCTGRKFLEVLIQHSGIPCPACSKARLLQKQHSAICWLSHPAMEQQNPPKSWETGENLGGGGGRKNVPCALGFPKLLPALLSNSCRRR